MISVVVRDCSTGVAPKDRLTPSNGRLITPEGAPPLTTYPLWHWNFNKLPIKGLTFIGNLYTVQHEQETIYLIEVGAIDEGTAKYESIKTYKLTIFEEYNPTLDSEIKKQLKIHFFEIDKIELS